MSNSRNIFDGDWPDGSRRGTKPGGNLRIKLRLTPQEIADSAEKKIKVSRQAVCKTCKGHGAQDKSSFQTCYTCNGVGQIIKVAHTILGRLETIHTCAKCHGTGSIILSKCKVCRGDGVERGEETITIDIPAGLSDGLEFIIKGEGDAGLRGGLPGNLIVLIEEVSPEKQQMLEKLKSHPDKNGKSYVEQVMDYIRLRKNRK